MLPPRPVSSRLEEGQWAKTGRLSCDEVSHVTAWDQATTANLVLPPLHFSPINTRVSRAFS